MVQGQESHVEGLGLCPEAWEATENLKRQRDIL